MSDFPKQQQEGTVGPMEPPKWRSKSLSELPGHLRVSVLRRKDTERTQARLEAGVAGLAELRLLREQQMALVEQTVKASIKQKQRPPSRGKLTRSTENLNYEMPLYNNEDGNSTRNQVCVLLYSLICSYSTLPFFFLFFLSYSVLEDHFIILIREGWMEEGGR